MRNLPLAAAVLLCAAVPRAQTNVQDLGLTMSVGMLTVIYGQVCGPFSCTPFPAGNVGAGVPAQVSHWGAPGTPFVLAIGFAPAGISCLAFPGIGNALLLDPAAVATLAVGTTPPSSPGTTLCNVARADVPFQIPAGVPAGIQFRLQSVGSGASHQLAFTVAIEAVTW